MILESKTETDVVVRVASIVVIAVLGRIVRTIVIVAATPVNTRIASIVELRFAPIFYS